MRRTDPLDATPKAIAALRSLLSGRLHITGASLADQTARIGRRLPRRIKGDLAVVARAELMGQNPRLRHQIDHKAVARASRNATLHLKTIDPQAERTTRILRALAKVAFVVLAVFVAVVWYLRSQGRI